MAIMFSLPDGIERQLRADLEDLDAVAKEATLVELYRQDKVSHGKLAESLGLSRYETDALLRRHAVTEDLLKPDELNQQTAELRNLVNDE